MTPFYNRNKRRSYPKQDIRNEQQSTWKATNLQELKPKKKLPIEDCQQGLGKTQT